ncbi:MAG: hypothetical protein ACJASQ_002955 [Crocinitomicaceae bacterium]
MPNKLQSYINAGLLKIGLYDKKAQKVGLRRIYPDDIYVVSFPKSGNTWVRFLLANMLVTDEKITMQNINDYVPGIYNFREKINKKVSNRIIKSHDPFFDCYPKTIYVYRDYRDVLVSYFHYLKGHDQFSGTVQDFLKSDLLETPFGTWQQHVSLALKQKEAAPSQLLFVGFNELKNDPIETLKKIAEFCEITPIKSYQEIVQQCDFKQLQESEQVDGKVFSDSKVNFFRSGVSEQWRTTFGSDDLDLILTDEVQGLLHQLNLKV